MEVIDEGVSAGIFNNVLTIQKLPRIPLALMLYNLENIITSVISSGRDVACETKEMKMSSSFIVCGSLMWDGAFTE